MRHTTALLIGLSPLLSAAWTGEITDCLKGAGVPLPPGCDFVDIDRDGDGDMSDFAWWQLHPQPPEQTVVYIFIFDRTLLGSIEPEEFVRGELNKRHERK